MIVFLIGAAEMLAKLKGFSELQSRCVTVSSNAVNE